MFFHEEHARFTRAVASASPRPAVVAFKIYHLLVPFVESRARTILLFIFQACVGGVQVLAPHAMRPRRHSWSGSLKKWPTASPTAVPGNRPLKKRYIKEGSRRCTLTAVRVALLYLRMYHMWNTDMSVCNKKR